MNYPACGHDTLTYHGRAERARRWMTIRCSGCGYVDTASWAEKSPPQRADEVRRGLMTSGKAGIILTLLGAILIGFLWAIS
jgi:hypothetical protein